MSKVTISALPFELLTQIVTKLPLSTLVRLRRVSRTFQAVSDATALPSLQKAQAYVVFDEDDAYDASLFPVPIAKIADAGAGDVAGLSNPDPFVYVIGYAPPPTPVVRIELLSAQVTVAWLADPKENKSSTTQLPHQIFSSRFQQAADAATTKGMQLPPYHPSVLEYLYTPTTPHPTLLRILELLLCDSSKMTDTEQIDSLSPPTPETADLLKALKTYTSLPYINNRFCTDPKDAFLYSLPPHLQKTLLITLATHVPPQYHHLQGCSEYAHRRLIMEHYLVSKGVDPEADVGLRVGDAGVV
ncbi:hypothetical protein HDV00_004544 [Rhizophlyctis rosea]|nr:hypothetical protein HDV00_004544 [Rhizophlyctis rosea]